MSDRRLAHPPIAALVAALVLTAALAGCGGDAPAPDGSVPGELTLPVLPDSLEAAAAIIVVGHAECSEPLPGVTRSRDEARERAVRLLAEALGGGAGFGELARRYSDDPVTRPRDGYLGIFRRGEMKLELEVPVFVMKPGEIRGVQESEQGFFIVKRLPVRRIIARHILIAWRGAERAPVAITRTREQARLLAEEVARLAAAGDDPCELARKFSDDAENRFECGFLGVVEPWMLPPELDAVAFGLAPGEFSGLVETPYGYHLVWRD